MIRLFRIVSVCAIAGLTAACFQPLYGERGVGNSNAGLRDKLGAVQVAPIDARTGSPDARIGVEIRNALLFDLTGGADPQTPSHRLKIALSTVRQQVIVDINTARADSENYGIDATYSLTDIATDKTILTGRTFARVSYDIPGQVQRFARARALRDAENRAAKVIANQIQMRLASFYGAGT